METSNNSGKIPPWSLVKVLFSCLGSQMNENISCVQKMAAELSLFLYGNVITMEKQP